MNLDSFGLQVATVDTWTCLPCGRILGEKFPRHFLCPSCQTWRRVALWEYAERGITPPADQADPAPDEPSDDEPDEAETE